MTRRRRAAVDVVELADHHVAVYDGRYQIGEVLIGLTIRALDAAGDELGTFASLKAATQAVIDAAKQERATR